MLELEKKGIPQNFKENQKQTISIFNWVAIKQEKYLNTIIKKKGNQEK